MIILVRLLSILLRCFAYTSPICQKLKDIFIFNQLNTSFLNLKDNIFLNYEFKDSNAMESAFFVSI